MYSDTSSYERRWEKSLLSCAAMKMAAAAIDTALRFFLNTSAPGSCALLQISCRPQALVIVVSILFAEFHR